MEKITAARSNSDLQLIFFNLSIFKIQILVCEIFFSFSFIYFFFPVYFTHCLGNIISAMVSFLRERAANRQE